MQENTIEIDSELYERLAIWSKECGQDDVNEFSHWKMRMASLSSVSQNW